MENKALFIKRVNDALIECGDGRYDHLDDNPLEYVRVGSEELVHVKGSENKSVCVTGDSLTGMLHDVLDGAVI